jgi:hypothetical protein
LSSSLGVNVPRKTPVGPRPCVISSTTVHLLAPLLASALHLTPLLSTNLGKIYTTASKTL